MDNRWRFLYYGRPELRGRMCRVRAGSERPGASAWAGGEQAPLGKRVREADRKEVGKRSEHVPRKAAMAPVIPVP